MSTEKWDSLSRGGWGWEQEDPSVDTMQSESKAGKVQALPGLNREGEGQKHGRESVLVPQLPSVLFYVTVTKISAQSEDILVYHSWEAWWSDSL